MKARIGILKARLRLGRQTIAYPEGPACFPERFRGRPVLDPSRCPPGCAACAGACPTEAISGVRPAPPHVRGPPDAAALSRSPLAPAQAAMRLDLGRCVFCGACSEACAAGALRFTRDYRLAARSRQDLLLAGDAPLLARALDDRMRRLFGRSLRLRQVSAAGCNGCEAELNASGNIQFDLSRFGIGFVASPRHADGVVVTGPVSENMLTGLRKTYEATPAPKLLVAIGACAISGGPFAGSPVVKGGVEGAIAGVPVDLWIPGCPPHPVTILDGLLRLLGRVEGDALRLKGTGIVGG